jgi:hypothetical protein
VEAFQPRTNPVDVFFMSLAGKVVSAHGHAGQAMKKHVPDRGAAGTEATGRMAAHGALSVHPM